MLDQKKLAPDAKTDFWIIVSGLACLVIAIVVVSVATHEPDRAVDKARDTPRPSLGVAPYIPPEPEKAKITKTKYLKVREGMSYREVVDIVGFHGSEDASASFQGITSKIYTWDNGNGSAMTGTFTNGRLDAKAQFGLR